MAGTNEFAFFRCKSRCTGGGGVQNQADKKFEKCLPAGTGTKIYFSSKLRKRFGSVSVSFGAANLAWHESLHRESNFSEIKSASASVM